MNNTKSELRGELGKIIEKLEDFKVQDPRKWYELNRLGRESPTGLTDTPLHRQACIRSRNHNALRSQRAGKNPEQ